MTENNIKLHINDLPKDTNLGNEIAIDSETMGLNLTRDRLCLIQIKGNDNTTHLIQFLDSNYEAPNLKKILEDKKILKIFHYARFDILAIHKYLNVLCENVFCTKIASKLSRTYTNKHSLKDLVKEFLDIELEKEQQSSNWGATQLSKQQLEYASYDVLYLHKLKNELTQRLIAENRLNLANKIFEFLPTKAILDDLFFSNENDIFNH
jgi:ribonuclease D